MYFEKNIKTFLHELTRCRQISAMSHSNSAQPAVSSSTSARLSGVWTKLVNAKIKSAQTPLNWAQFEPERPFNLSGLGEYDPKYSKNQLELRLFVLRPSTRPFGMGLPRPAWVRLNRLCTGVGRSSHLYISRGLASTSTCECSALDQTATHVILECPLQRALGRYHGLLILEDETRCWLNNKFVANIWERPPIRRRARSMISNKIFSHSGPLQLVNASPCCGKHSARCLNTQRLPKKVIGLGEKLSGS